MTHRGNMRKWFMLVTLLLVMVALLFSVCAGEAAPIPTAISGKTRTLRIIMPGEPDSLNRVKRATALAAPVMENVIEPLIDVGKKGGAVPKLATKWEHSPDLTKWRFYLRKGVKFHNGADFTARDVVETAKFLADVKDVSVIYPRVSIKEAIAVDDYTVDLIFEKPQPLLLVSVIRFFPVYPTAIARDKRETAETFPIGTGPYRFVEWRRGQYVKLAQFKDYWGQKPQIDEVVITWRAEAGVRLAALKAGEVDWVYGLNIDEVSIAPKVVRRASDETVWFRFDESIQKAPIFADKRLRLAVEYAIDRKAVVSLYGGFATPSLGQFASPGEFGFNPDLKSRPYDLEKARALVREAGAVGKTVTIGGTTGRWAKDREAAEAVAYMIEQTGLKVKLMLMSKEEAQKYQRTTGEGRLYMTDIFFFPSDALLEVESRGKQLFMEGGTHYALNDLKSTRLYEEELAETDIAKREEKLRKIWEYLYEQVHYVPIFKLEWIWGLAKNLEWEPDLAGRPIVADMKFTD